MAHAMRMLAIARCCDMTWVACLPQPPTVSICRPGMFMFLQIRCALLVGLPLDYLTPLMMDQETCGTAKVIEHHQLFPRSLWNKRVYKWLWMDNTPYFENTFPVNQIEESCRRIAHMVRLQSAAFDSVSGLQKSKS